MIFFDIDGTLLDHKTSEYLGAKAFYKEYKQYFKLDEEEFYKKWHSAADKYFNKYLNGEITFEQQRIERIKEVFAFSSMKPSDGTAESIFNKYLKIYENNWRPFKDVFSCLQQLHEYKLGIISNGDLKQQSLKLEKIGIKQYFSIIVTAGEAGIAKPNVKLFDIACKRADEIPQNCYYVGDDLKTDIIPCSEIGMKGIWINRDNEETKIDGIKMITSLDELKNNKL